MSCEIYTKSLLKDADRSSLSLPHSNALLNLTEAYSDAISGIWLPLIITASESNINYCELLAQPFEENVQKFNPCECSDEQIFGLEISDLEEFPDLSLECNYCDTCDTDPCDENTTCEVRMNNDDWTPKIRYLHQGYITGFYDFKNLNQFPSCSNPGLGFEKFIEMDSQTFTSAGADKIYIDWKLQETISEIPYDPYSSKHTNEYTHNKTYIKSKRRSETCGNFIYLNGEMPQEVESPYGFTNQTYDNIYVTDRHLGSHWKWNYQSGIMGWYRHYDIDRQNDQRPLTGMDLYIPPGDIFYATNDGPEGTASNPGATSCPSGLKIVNGTELVDIIPDGSSFVYISTNMYERFLESRDRLSAVGISDIKKALLLCTHPEYDNIATDLLNPDGGNLNALGQSTLLNQYMTSGTDFRSAFNLYYCETNDILINTLAHKYGAYMLIDDTADLNLSTTVNNSTAFYVDLDFDMVIPCNKKHFSNANGGMLPNVDISSFSRKFVYNQTISVGSRSIMNTAYSNQNIQNVNYSTLYFMGSQVATAYNNSGSYHFEDEYPDEAVLRRRYPAGAFNPHIDMVAVHEQGGIHTNSIPFGLDGQTFFLDGVAKPVGDSININFSTLDCAIKLYDIQVKRIQSSSNTSKSCERFPHIPENSCKCYGFGTGGSGLPVTTDTTVYGTSKFLPSLSTQTSPTIKLKGGYSQSYLDDFFGTNVVTAGGNLTKIDNKNDHPTKEDCNRQASIDLVNYINSDYTVDIVNENINTKFLVTATEGVRLSANRFIGDPEDEVDNMNWKRFTTKVTINSDKVIYDEKQAIVQDAGNSFNIHLTNPFLAELIDDTTNNYYPPHYFPDFWNRPGYSPCDVASRVYSKRGDESSVVKLSFKEYRPKKLFNFYIPPPTTYGTLQRGEFHPNFGLKNGNGTNNPIKNDKPYYEESIDSETFDNNKAIVYGSITDSFERLSNVVSNFEMNRKLRLYIKQGRQWYLVQAPKRKSYVFRDKKYIGKPKLFEYVKTQKDSLYVPGVIPFPPKQLSSWKCFLNYADLNNASVSNHLKESYPFINGIDFQVVPTNTRKIIFPGSRYYFMAKTDLKVYNANVPSFDDLSQIQITYPSQSLVMIGPNSDDNVYYYEGGGSADKGNYIHIGRRYRDFFGVDSDLRINFNNSSEYGYIYDTKKKCSHDIRIFNNNLGVVSTVNNKIISKELYMYGYNAAGQPDQFNPVTYQLSTIFTLENSININRIYGVSMTDPTKNISLCIYANTNHTEFSEYLHNEYIHTKWSDVIWYDNLYEKYIKDEYIANIKSKDSLYKNSFAKQIINDLNTDNLFDITLYDGSSTKNLTVNSEKVAYNILQKYNIHKNPEKLKLKSSYNYENFIPMMDINIFDVDFTSLMPGNNQTNIGVPITGYIKTPNFLQPVESFSNGYTQPNNELFVNIEEEDLLTSSYVSAGVYSETLRLDDPYFSLAGTIKTTSNANFKASAGTFNQNPATISRDHPFAIFDNYDDNDTGGGLSSNSNSSASASNVSDLEEVASIQTISTIIDTLIPGGLPYVTSPLPDPVITPPASRQDGCSEQDSTTCSLSVNGSTSLFTNIKIHNFGGSLSNVPNSMDYFFTYDAGIYNGLGQKNLINISKSVLPADNPLYSAYDFCNTSYLRPNLIRTFHDQEAQKTIKDNIATKNNTDKNADEMLFRILYGEADYINRKMLNSNYEPLTAEDLVNYADPKLTAKDIYDEILYNYDVNAEFNDFFINGSFTLNTKVAIGKVFDINVDGTLINFTIERNGGAIQANGTIDGNPFLATIYNEYTVSTSMRVTEENITLSNTNTTTYELKRTSQQSEGYTYRPYARRIYTGDCIGLYEYNSLSDIPIPALSHYSCGTIGARVITQDIHIANCPSANCQAWPNVRLEVATTTDNEPVAGNPVNPVAQNFSYTFKKCRTNFTLDGFRLAKGAGPCDVSFGYCNIDTDACGPYIPYSYVPDIVTVTAINPVDEEPERFWDRLVPPIRGQQWFDICSGRACIGVNPITTDLSWDQNVAPQPGLLNPCHPNKPNRSREYENTRKFPDSYKQPCEGVGLSQNNFYSADPGYDQCGYVRGENIIRPKKYWLSKTKTYNDPWNEDEIVALFTVTYNNRQISITIGDVYKCVDASIDDCPNLSVTVPKGGYITESVDSGCDRCSDIPLKLRLSTNNNYQTVKEIRRMDIATIAGTDVNSGWWVQTYTATRTAQAPPGPQAYAACGQPNKMWIANEADSHGNNARGRPEFIRTITQAFNNINYEFGENGVPYNIGGRWNTNSVLNAKRICNGSNNAILEADIISGPVPNSCTSLQFETTTREYNKYRTSTDGKSIEQDTGTHYTVTAYIEYDYVRPVSVYDKVKEILGVTCSVDYNEQDIYPDWYGSLVGVPNIYYVSVPNFVGRKPIFFNSCGGATDCYYKGADDDPCGIYYAGDCVDKAPAPCADNDWICWATNNSAWLKLRY